MKQKVIETNEKYHFFSDQSHGWLKVLQSELESLGIAEKISKYSYTNDKYVYLEEDCDATLFCNAKQNQSLGYDLKDNLIEHNTNSRSSIRSYQIYTSQ